MGNTKNKCRRHPESEQYYFVFFEFWQCMACQHEENEKITKMLVERLTREYPDDPT